MKLVLTLALLGLASVTFMNFSEDRDTLAKRQFDGFIQTFDADYKTTEEYEFRLKVFKDNLETYEEMRQRNPRATFGVTQFSDRTPEEFESMLGLLPEDSFETPAELETGQDLIKTDKLKKFGTISWVDLMGPSKRQGTCGSCWTFGAVGLAEGRYAISQGQTKVTQRFSEQALLDCETESHGCDGGWTSKALAYWMTHDIGHEEDYPYKAEQGECKQRDYTHIRLNSIMRISENFNRIISELQNGPVVISVPAGGWSGYRGGILESCPGKVNHAVVLVGINSEEGSITIRNSWGPKWGEKGNIRVDAYDQQCSWLRSPHSVTFKQYGNKEP